MRPVPRGGFHKAGEGPAFGGSLVTFCPVRKLPQRSVPARLASLKQGRLDGQPLTSPFGRGGTAPAVTERFSGLPQTTHPSGAGFPLQRGVFLPYRPNRALKL